MFRPVRGRKGVSVARGDADNKRTRTVAVRLTPAEYAVWDAARVASGRREMGAWVRAVVGEVVTRRRAGRRPGDLARTVVPEVNADAVRQLTGVATNLNQLAHWANTERRAVQDAELHRLLVALEQALYAVRGTVAPATSTGTTAVYEGVAEPAAADGDEDQADEPGRWRPRWPRRAVR
jgi:hypothetical protein